MTRRSWLVPPPSTFTQAPNALPWAWLVGLLRLWVRLWRTGGDGGRNRGVRPASCGSMAGAGLPLCAVAANARSSGCWQAGCCSTFSHLAKSSAVACHPAVCVSRLCLLSVNAHLARAASPSPSTTRTTPWEPVERTVGHSAVMVTAGRAGCRPTSARSPFSNLGARPASTATDSSVASRHTGRPWASTVAIRSGLRPAVGGQAGSPGCLMRRLRLSFSVSWRPLATQLQHRRTQSPPPTRGSPGRGSRLARLPLGIFRC